MSIQNTLALLDTMRVKGVMAYRNQHGQIVFAGMGKITTGQREVLLAIPQAELSAAMKWQCR